MIKKYKAQNPDVGLVVLWIKLMRNGYTRQITSLDRVMQRLGIYIKAPSKKKKYEPKPYQKMSHPGERIQIDVKYVPQKCMSNELKELGIEHKLIKPRTPRHNGRANISYLVYEILDLLIKCDICLTNLH